MSMIDSSTRDSEKPSSLSSENAKEKDVGVQLHTLEATEDLDPSFETRTMRYVDWRILPFLALVYSFSLIDRINLGAARTAGMGAALDLTKQERFSVATCLYFVPYILLQIPGNLFLRRLGARNLITTCVVGWGAIELAMAFVPTWGYLTLCRILLGAFEAAFFPALVFIISTWYRRHEVQKRLAAFYLLSVTISGFSSILAYALSLLDGKRGIAGWSWIFLIEGAITMFLGIIGYFIMPDFPDKNTFLTPAQTALVLKRVEMDRHDSVPDQITFGKVMHHLQDWTLWAYGVMFACSTLPAYMLAYFISIILKGMGFSTTDSLLLSAPPYGPAFISAMFFAWISDKKKHRAGFIGIQALITLVGVCLTAFSSSNGVRYFGTFCINAGSSGCIPGVMAYGANNVVSQSKRAVQG
ncbi:hypothetical protein VKT23_000573 [Stygiomarasmius scandens]|uniref:Major facilitator superfamily (MFS) profile domain-containing protein n=1 Tax=Marasmiellus scandens TaxID=2682957 RepID=A0ABR1K9W3_9AGAR